MLRSESITLGEPQPSDPGEYELRDTEQDGSNLEQADSMQWESNRKRAAVLVGTAISQLPIWGMLILTS